MRQAGAPFDEIEDHIHPFEIASALAASRLLDEICSEVVPGVATILADAGRHE
jgi:hypothetical protein